MKNALVAFFFSLFAIGVFGADDVTFVSVIVGDSVTLNTNVTVHGHVVIDWRFKGLLIARINSMSNKVSLSVYTGAFNDRLQLDNKTGNIKIKNFRTTDTGLYELDIISTVSSSKKINISAVNDSRFDGVTVVSVTEGDSVVLHADTEILKDDEILWRFSEKEVIAKIKKDEHIFSTYDVPDGRFRHRLHLNYQTGNLIISDIMSNTSGLYEVDVKRRSYTIHKSFNVTITDKLNRVLVKEGVTVILASGVTELDGDDLVQWRFEHEDILAEINKTSGVFSTYDDVLDGRFRGRLKLDDQTGSLTIMNTRPDHTGLYHLDITSVRHVIFRKVFLSVSDACRSWIVAAVVLGVLLLMFVAAAAGVICYRYRCSKQANMERRIEVPRYEVKYGGHMICEDHSGSANSYQSVSYGVRESSMHCN